MRTLYDGKVKSFWLRTEMASPSIKFLFCDIGAHISKNGKTIHQIWLPLASNQIEVIVWLENFFGSNEN